MTMMTPELAHPSPNFHATPAGGHLATMHSTGPIHDRSSMESGFEPGTLRFHEDYFGVYYVTLRHGPMMKTPSDQPLHSLEFSVPENV
ncbi:hypothetical protein AVEN_238284-1 [Araneus ventricosus]|uniref:Uncharacterized protein n=1 Tax=Araneus ventricosus TaxID=182803 RepID=A0A4Y2J029_ARAVE|nr:hypothetical protein AVEN_238284-1 [Araneus ventricosus]